MSQENSASTPEENEEEEVELEVEEEHEEVIPPELPEAQIEEFEDFEEETDVDNITDGEPPPFSDELTDVIRLPSLHTPVLDVDPDLVVHRFSQTGHSDNLHTAGEYEMLEGQRDTEEEGNAFHEEEGNAFWEVWNHDEGHDEDHDEEWRDSFETGDYGSEYYYDEDQDLTNMDENDEREDTIRTSLGQNNTTSTDTDPTGSSPHHTKKHAKIRPTGPTPASFRWFERNVLSQQIPESEENQRRMQLLEKCSLVRKVSKPIVTIFGGKSKTIHGKMSTQSIKLLREMNNPKYLDGSAADLIEDDDTAGITLPEFSEKEWALKNAIDYLKTAGCSSSRTPTYSARLKSAKEEAADFRIALYEKQLKRRRNAIGNQLAAPEITAALRRHAERAICRAVIDNTKPRYPLPRFILPRHQYLRKVQAQFIGPGSYEHEVYDTQVKLRRMQLPSTWSGCSTRFPKDPASSDQGQSAPVLLDPWTTLDAANNQKKYPGTYIPFESTPKNYRGIALLDRGGSRVPPNAYNIKSPLDEFIKKRTSLRGPYDCYTPSRNVIPYGYYKSPSDESRSSLGPGSYEIGTNVDKEINNSYQSFKGKFGKADRESIFGFKAAFDKPLWPRKGVNIPPPGQYDIAMDVIGSDREQMKEPFMIGTKAKEFQKVELMAPDYYYYAIGATWTAPPGGTSCGSVFRSKTPQIMSKQMTDIRKQRNKAVNKKINMEEGAHQVEVHYAPEVQFKKDYALEDCPNVCIGGPKIDLFAVPGYGIGSLKGQALSGKCCN